MKTATFSFRADVPDDIDPEDLTILELAELVTKHEILPRADLPWVTIDDRAEKSRELAKRKVGIR